MKKKDEKRLNIAIAETWISVIKTNPDIIKTLRKLR